jgi:mRNA interferase MazF
MPLPRIQRGELWVVDLGYLGKVRPALIVGVPYLDHERTLCLMVPHTSSLRGTRFEVAVDHPSLGEGAFDVQQTAAVPAIKFVRRLGSLNPQDMRRVENVLAHALGLKLAAESGED